MLQIITYLLCVYLIFKGIEIYQVGDMGPEEHRERGKRRGGVMIIVSILVSLLFAYWITIQGESIATPSTLP